MMSDPIADMLTRLRNAQMAGKKSVSFSNSRLKRAILDVLKSEGYVEQYEVSAGGREIVLQIKYYVDRPAIERISRVSRPGLRRYASAGGIPLVQNGLGISVLSTSRGVMSDHQARAAGVGGEIICEVA